MVGKVLAAFVCLNYQLHRSVALLLLFVTPQGTSKSLSKAREDTKGLLEELVVDTCLTS